MPLFAGSNTRKSAAILLQDADRNDENTVRARIAPLDDIAPDIWDDLASERRTPMQQYGWVRAAAATIGAGRNVSAMIVGPSCAPSALAPLQVHGTWLKSARLLGADELGESVEVVYRNEAALDELANGFARTGLPIGFGHYLSDTPFIASLRRAYRRRGVVVSRPLSDRACPSIKLDKSWLEPESKFNARRRSDFRRMRRTAEKLGRVSIEILAPAAADCPPLLDEALAIEARGWKGRSGTAVAANGEQNRFYRSYANLAAQQGILRIRFLRIDGQAVAMQLAAETNGRFWLFKIGYDERFRRCSPGNLLLSETIRYAAGSDLVSFEFLGKEAAWTQLWTQEARPVVALRVYPYNLSGAAALVADAYRFVRRRVRHRRPPEPACQPEASEC